MMYCQECGGDLVFNMTTHEIICDTCGLVEESQSYITDASKYIFSEATAKKALFHTSKDVPKFKSYSLRRTQHRVFTNCIKEEHRKSLFASYTRRGELPRIILARANYLLFKLEKKFPRTPITETTCEGLIDLANIEMFPEKRRTINKNASRRVKSLSRLLNITEPFKKSLGYIDYANDTFSKITPDMELYEILPELRVGILNSYKLMPEAFKEIEKNRVKSLVKGILKDISEEMPGVIDDCLEGKIPNKLKRKLKTEEMKKLEKIVFSISGKHRRYVSMNFLCANIYFIADKLLPKTQRTKYKSQKNIPSVPISMLVSHIQKANCSVTTALNSLLTLSPERMMVDREIVLAEHKEYLELYERSRIKGSIKGILKDISEEMPGVIDDCLKGKIPNKLKRKLKTEEIKKLEKIVSSTTEKNLKIIIPLSTVGYELLKITGASPTSVAWHVSRVKTYYKKKEGSPYKVSHTILTTIKNMLKKQEN